MNESLKGIYFEISPCIELPDGDLTQMIGVDENAIYLEEVKAAILHEMNTPKCEGMEMVFPTSGFDDEFIPVKDGFVMAIVIYMWG